MRLARWGCAVGACCLALAACDDVGATGGGDGSLEGETIDLVVPDELRILMTNTIGVVGA